MGEFLHKLGERIASLRLVAGMKQTDLAHKAGLSLGYMSRLERGETNISILNLRALAKALDIPLAVLLECEQNVSHTELVGYISRHLMDITSEDLVCLHRITSLLRRKQDMRMASVMEAIPDEDRHAE